MQVSSFLRTSLACLSLAIASATAANAADPGVSGDEIKIGLFGPLSGPLIGYGQDPLNAAKMLYDDINAKGGIHGRKIRLIVEDDKCQPNDLVAVVKKLVTVDQVFMLHGGSCTAAVAAAQDYINREKVPYAMLNAAGDGAVFPPTNYVFGSFHGTQRAYAAGLATYAAKTLGAKRAAIVVHDDDYGNANLESAKTTLVRLGVEVVAVERISAKITDVTAPMLNLRAAKPDVILSGAYPAPAVLIAQKYGEYGMKMPLLQSTQGIPNAKAFAENVGNKDALANFYHSWSFTDLGDKAIHDKYLAMYKAHFPDRDPTPFFVSGLPSAMVVIEALKAAGRDVTRESLVAALQKVSLSTDIMAGPLEFGERRRDALRTVFVVKFDGEKQTVQPGAYSWSE